MEHAEYMYYLTVASHALNVADKLDNEQTIDMPLTYDTVVDPEGYVRSVLIAMMVHCKHNGIDFDCDLEFARDYTEN